MNAKYLFWLLFFCANTISFANSAEILTIEINYEEGIYTMTSDVWFDAKIENIFEVYSNWDYSTQFSSAIVEARDIEPDTDGRPQFYVRNQGCILFFCKSFIRQGYIEFEENAVLRAFTNPELSDFYLSNEQWKFNSYKGGTTVSYSLKMSPKFWVPPGIGPYLIKQKLKTSGGEAVNRIEIIARELAYE